MHLRLNEQHPAALLVALPLSGIVLAALLGYVVAWRALRRWGLCASQ